MSIGPWYTSWLRREPDGWMLKIGPFACGRYGWFGDSWILHGFNRVIVLRRKA